MEIVAVRPFVEPHSPRFRHCCAPVDPEQDAKPSDETSCRFAVMTKVSCANGRSVRQTWLFLPCKPRMQFRLGHQYVRKARVQFLGTLRCRFGMKKQLVFFSNEIRKKLLQSAISLIVRHNPRSHEHDILMLLPRIHSAVIALESPLPSVRVATTQQPIDLTATSLHPAQSRLTGHYSAIRPSPCHQGAGPCRRPP